MGIDPPPHQMSEVLNANPTIRSVSDLPSRQGRLSKSLSRKGSLGLLTSTIPLSAYTPDPFSPPSDLEDSDEVDPVEPIDEQEIYGTPYRPFSRISRCHAGARPLHYSQLTAINCRPHLPNHRSRASSHTGLLVCRQPSRYPYKALGQNTKPYRGHSPDYAYNHSLLVGYRHRLGSTGPPRASPSASFQG